MEKIYKLSSRGRFCETKDSFNKGGFMVKDGEQIKKKVEATYEVISSDKVISLVSRDEVPSGETRVSTALLKLYSTKNVIGTVIVKNMQYWIIKK